MSKEPLILQLTTEAIEKLDAALIAVVSLRHENTEADYSVEELVRAMGIVRKFQEPLFTKYPEYKPPPVWADALDPCFTAAEKAAVAQLSKTEIQHIDDALLSYANCRFQKVAMIVAEFMAQSTLHKADIPDLFYAMRIEALVGKQRLVHQGNLQYMRYCEVKLPQ